MTASDTDIVACSFVWSVSNVTLAHLIFNLRRLSKDAGDKAKEPEDDDIEEGVECAELPVLRMGYSEESDSGCYQR